MAKSRMWKYLASSAQRHAEIGQFTHDRSFVTRDRQSQTVLDGNRRDLLRQATIRRRTIMGRERRCVVLVQSTRYDRSTC